MSKPSVLVNLYATILDPRFFMTFLNFYRENQNNIELCFQWRIMIHDAQRKGADAAVEHEYEYLLNLEDDTTMIPEGTLQRLIDHDKDVVAPWVVSRHPPHEPTARKLVEGRLTTPGSLSCGLRPGNGVMECDLIGMQFTLIKTSALKKLSKPWFFYGECGCTDQYFSQKCIDEGVKKYCDTDLCIEHDGVGVQHYNAMKQMQKTDGVRWN